MASYQDAFSPRSITIQSGTGGAPVVSSRSAKVSRKYIPDKVVGTYITLPNGQKFRRATNYARMLTSMEPGPSQDTKAINTEPLWLNNQAFIRANSGGYRSDDLFSLFWTVLSSADITNINTIPDIPGSMRNEANTKALLNLADQKVNLGENLATLHQAVGLLKNPLSGLIEGIRRMHKNAQLHPLRRKSFREMQRGGTPKAVANLYLQYIYGVVPLMQDVYGALDLMKTSAKKDLLIHSVGRSKREPNVSDKTVRNVSNEATTKLVNVKVTDRVNSHIWARIDPNYSGTRALNQLGLLNPASLAWELVPWSFVIDWVLPIGSVLQALTAPAGLIFVSGSVARKVTATAQYEHWNDKFEGNYPVYDLVSDSHAGGQFTYRGYKREVHATWPQAGLWIDPDPLRGDRSFKALALAVANLKAFR